MDVHVCGLLNIHFLDSQVMRELVSDLMIDYELYSSVYSESDISIVLISGLLDDLYLVFI